MGEEEIKAFISSFLFSHVIPSLMGYGLWILVQINTLYEYIYPRPKWEKYPFAYLIKLSKYPYSKKWIYGFKNSLHSTDFSLGVIYQSLVGPVVIGVGFGKENHCSISHDCDREGPGTTWYHNWPPNRTKLVVKNQKTKYTMWNGW